MNDKTFPQTWWKVRDTANLFPLVEVQVFNEGDTNLLVQIPKDEYRGGCKEIVEMTSFSGRYFKDRDEAIRYLCESRAEKLRMYRQWVRDEEALHATIKAKFGVEAGE